MVECGGLENRYLWEQGSWVRIPLSPPYFAKASYGTPVTSKENTKIFIEKIEVCPSKLAKPEGVDKRRLDLTSGTANFLTEKQSLLFITLGTCGIIIKRCT